MITTRTTIQFGLPGDQASIAHARQGNTLIIQELKGDSTIEVGEQVAPGYEDEFTGREWALEFKSSKTASYFLSNLIEVCKDLHEAELAQQRKDFENKFGRVAIVAYINSK